MKDAVLFYRRRLPHYQPPGATIFLTWRLYGSLPKETLDRLAEERHHLEQQSIRPHETPQERTLRHDKRLFALADEMLAKASSGPRWMKDERVASLVMEELFHNDANLYTLLAFVVMPNHVHTLLRPLEAHGDLAAASRQSKEGDIHPGKSSAPDYVLLRTITQTIKGRTAREANLLLKRTGQFFWQDESYDHCVRDEAELGRIVLYIESDPVRSGLVSAPEEWRWSSAWERRWGRLKERSW